MIILPILTTAFTHLLFKRLGECTIWAWEWKGNTTLVYWTRGRDLLFLWWRYRAHLYKYFNKYVKNSSEISIDWGTIEGERCGVSEKPLLFSLRNQLAREARDLCFPAVRGRSSENWAETNRCRTGWDWGMVARRWKGVCVPLRLCSLKQKDRR